MDKEKKLYKIEFNEFGVCYAVAYSLQEAESLFWKKYGGNSPTFIIKSIVHMPASSVLS